MNSKTAALLDRGIEGILIDVDNFPDSTHGDRQP
jgi:hypothetical protein